VNTAPVRRRPRPLGPMLLLAFGDDGEAELFPCAMTDREMAQIARGLQRLAARLIENPSICRRMAGAGARR
jgi:hypothetical protein